MTDDELNAAAAVEVMGWQERAARTRFPGAWSPATNIADAFEVVERMREQGFYISCFAGASNEYQWAVNVEACPILGEAAQRGLPWGRCLDAPLPRAICEAALAAVRSEHD